MTINLTEQMLEVIAKEGGYDLKNWLVASVKRLYGVSQSELEGIRHSHDILNKHVRVDEIPGDESSLYQRLVDPYSGSKKLTVPFRISLLEQVLNKTRKNADDWHKAFQRLSEEYTELKSTLEEDESTVELANVDAFIESLVGKGGMKRHSKTFLEAVLGMDSVPNQGDVLEEPQEMSEKQAIRLEAFGKYLTQVGTACVQQALEYRLKKTDSAIGKK